MDTVLATPTHIQFFEISTTPRSDFFKDYSLEYSLDTTKDEISIGINLTHQNWGGLKKEVENLESIYVSIHDKKGNVYRQFKCTGLKQKGFVINGSYTKTGPITIKYVWEYSELEELGLDI